MINVLIVDRITILRECLKIAIEKNKNYIHCHYAKNELEAIEITKEINPNVILINLNILINSEYKTIKAIRKVNNNSKIIVLSFEEDLGKVNCALENGADIYLNKNINLDTLITNILSICNFNINYSDFIFKEKKIRLTNQNDINLFFTKREAEVISLVEKGLTNKEISIILGISKGRVNNIVATLLDKTMSKNRVQLAMLRVKTNNFYNHDEKNIKR